MTMEKELLRHTTKKPATLLYPSVTEKPVEGSRARVQWEMETCIGCGLCPQVCPSTAIELSGTGETTEITYHLDRCIFCGECLDICPTNAIETVQDLELAFNASDQMTIHYCRDTSHREE